jgi:hypothetical protein
MVKEVEANSTSSAMVNANILDKTFLIEGKVTNKKL